MKPPIKTRPAEAGALRALAASQAGLSHALSAEAGALLTIDPTAATAAVRWPTKAGEAPRIITPPPASMAAHDLEAWHGLIDHEVAHLRFTGRGWPAHARRAVEEHKNQRAAFLLNALEDGRVNARLAREFRGCAGNLAAMYMDAETRHPLAGRDWSDPWIARGMAALVLLLDLSGVVPGIMDRSRPHLDPAALAAVDKWAADGHAAATLAAVTLAGLTRPLAALVPEAEDDGEPKEGDQEGKGEPKAGEPKAGEPKAGEPKAGEPKAGEPKEGEPKAGEPKAGEPKAGEPKEGEPKAGEPKAGEPKEGEPKAGEPKAGEPKAGEPKAGEKPADTGHRGAASSDPSQQWAARIPQDPGNDVAPVMHAPRPSAYWARSADDLPICYVTRNSWVPSAPWARIGTRTDPSRAAVALAAAYGGAGAAHHLAHAWDAQAARRRIPDQEDGHHLSDDGLARVALRDRDPRPWVAQVDRRAPATFVHVLVDGSGSMGGRWCATVGAAWALAHAAAGCRGVQVAVSANVLADNPPDPAGIGERQTLARLAVYGRPVVREDAAGWAALQPSGSTETWAACLVAAAQDLCNASGRKPARRILLALSDGGLTGYDVNASAGPGGGDMGRRCDAIEAAGVELHLATMGTAHGAWSAYLRDRYRPPLLADPVGPTPDAARVAARQWVRQIAGLLLPRAGKRPTTAATRRLAYEAAARAMGAA